MKIKMFKTTKETKRFSKNQKVFITKVDDACFHIKFKYRGKNRYVKGTIGKHHKAIGEIKEIDIDEDFYKRLMS